MKNFKIVQWVLKIGLGIPLLLADTACSDLLEVSDPDLLSVEDLSGSQGADLVWGGGIFQFAETFGGHRTGHAAVSALFSDEYYDVAVDNSVSAVDLRDAKEDNWYVAAAFLSFHAARVSTRNAAEFLEELNPDDPRVAEMWSLNGYTYLMLAEDFCSGAPFSRTTLDGELNLGGPLTTEEMIETSLSRFESALAKAQGNADLRNLASVGMGRALVNLGRHAEAGQAVAAVPTGWSYQIAYGEEWNHHAQNFLFPQFSLSEREGTTGLPFRSANDPRLPWTEWGVGTDGQSPFYAQDKYPERNSPMTLAGGFEARYLEAEAALQAGDGTTFLGHLNAVRDAYSMDQISDPGDFDSRVDLLFYERGFTLWGEGHRLGSMRRLIRQYGRGPEEVFPTGAYHKTGWSYGSDVNLILPEREEDNPNFVGCLGRGA